MDLGNENWTRADDLRSLPLKSAASEHGVLASSAEEAVRLLMATNRGLPNLSRIMIVTLGAQATEVAWDRLLSEYINRGGLQ